MSDVRQAQYHDLAYKFYEENAVLTKVAETTDSMKSTAASRCFDESAELAPPQSGETAHEESETARAKELQGPGQGHALVGAGGRVEAIARESGSYKLDPKQIPAFAFDLCCAMAALTTRD